MCYGGDTWAGEARFLLQTVKMWCFLCNQDRHRRLINLMVHFFFYLSHYVHNPGGTKLPQKKKETDGFRWSACFFKWKLRAGSSNGWVGTVTRPGGPHGRGTKAERMENRHGVSFTSRQKQNHCNTTLSTLAFHCVIVVAWIEILQFQSHSSLYGPSPSVVPSLLSASAAELHKRESRLI